MSYHAGQPKQKYSALGSGVKPLPLGNSARRHVTVGRQVSKRLLLHDFANKKLLHLTRFEPYYLLCLLCFPRHSLFQQRLAASFLLLSDLRQPQRRLHGRGTLTCRRSSNTSSNVRHSSNTSSNGRHSSPSSIRDSHNNSLLHRVLMGRAMPVTP